MVIRVDQMRMERHHDSQRSGRLPVTFVDLRVVDRFPPACDGSPLGVGWMRRQDGMKRDDDSQRGGRLAVTRPVHYTPPPPPPPHITHRESTNRSG